MKKITIATLAFLFSLLPLSGCEQQKPQSYQQQILALGTLVDVVIYGVDEEKGQAAVERVAEILGKIHKDWHAWQPSKLTEINKKLASGESAVLDDTGLHLIERATTLSTQSGDLFDPAAGALIELWGFHSDQRDDAAPPSETAIAELVVQHPRMEDLVLQGRTLSSTNPAVQLDFGGFAKGFAVDQAIAALKSMGIRNAIINAGGDLRAIGSKNGQPWRIGIRNPRDTGVIAALQVEGDESVFTSGDYERYFEYQGQRYHHIIDPRSGRPSTGASSVTVIHKDATTADAAATALMIAGPDQWYETAKAMGIDQAMLIDNQGVVHMTYLMAKRTYLANDPKPTIDIVDMP